MRSPTILIPYIRDLVVDGQPDRDLLGRFVERRDEAAFAALLRRHGPMVWAACRRILPCDADAEDVFQKTFLLLAQKADRLRDHDTVGGWLYGVAYRLALRARSEAGVRTDRESRTPSRPPPDPPLAEITGRDTKQRVHDALARLPERYRAVLVLCDLEGRKQYEAARQLGCSLSTLKRRLEEGRTRLGQQLVRHGVTLPAAALAATLAPPADAALPPALTAAVLRAVTGVPAADGGGRAMGGLLAGRLRLAVAALAITVALAAGGVAFWATSGRGDKADVPQPGDRRRVDRFGDPLPGGALARIGTTRFWHDEPLLQPLIAFTAGGKRLVLFEPGVADRGIRVWDAATGREQCLLVAEPGTSFNRAWFSSDGNLAATQCSGKEGVTIWDLTTGTRVKDLGHGHYTAVCLAPDGGLLATVHWGGKGLDSCIVETWDVVAGKQPLASWEWAEVKDRNSGISLAFTGDGKTLMTAGGLHPVVRFWEATSGKNLRRLNSRVEDADAGASGDDDVRGFHFAPGDFPQALSPGGKLIASIEPTPWPPRAGETPTQRVRIQDAADGKVLRQIEVPATKGRGAMMGQRRISSSSNGVGWFAFSPDGKVLAGASANGFAYLWDVATGKELARFTTAASLSVAFSPDLKTVAVATGNAVRLYDVASGKELPPGPRLDHAAASISLTPDGRTLATADWTSSVVLWDTATGEQLRRLEHEGWVTYLFLSADGSTLFSGGGDGLRVWDVATGRQLQKLPAGFSVLACSPDGKRLAGWAKREPVRLAEPGFVGNDVYGLQVIDTLTGKCVREIGPPGAAETNPFAGAVFLPDGRSLVVWDRPRVHVWDLATGKDIRQFELAEPVNRGEGPFHVSHAFSPDGRLVAVQRGGQIAVHELADGTEVCRSEKLGRDAECLALSPDGRTLAWGSYYADSLVHVVDIVTGKERHAFEGHSGGIISLTFSADGKKLVSGSTDTTLLVWDMTALQSRPESGQPAKPIPPRNTPTTKRGPTTTAKGTERR